MHLLPKQIVARIQPDNTLGYKEQTMTVHNPKDNPKNIKAGAETKIVINNGNIEPEHESGFIRIGPIFN